MSKKKTYKRLLRWVHKLHPYVYPIPKPTRAELTVEIQENNKAIISLGDKSFHIHSLIATQLTHENYDFALYGAVAIALTHNIEIYSDIPISKSCYESIRSVHRAFLLLKPMGIHVQPVSLTNIIEDPKFNSNAPGLMCMSGGVDSTFAAIDTPKKLNYTHGMLVAGADYPSIEAMGFKELSRSVQSICNTVGMSLVEVEISIRNHKVQWGMLHGLCLVMCQRFHSSVFGKGAIAADFTALQEVAMGPWGNSEGIIKPLSTPNFPIEHMGKSTFRSDKLKAIVDTHPALVREISVCYTNKDTGKNCGECRKCVRTMLALYALGIDYKDYFLTERELLSLAKDPPPAPDSQFVKRLILSWYIEEEVRLPEGDIKDAIRHYVEELKEIVLYQSD